MRQGSLNNSFSSSFINNGFSKIEEEEEGIENTENGEEKNDIDAKGGRKRVGVIFAPDTFDLNETHKNAMKRRKRGTMKKTTKIVTQKIMKEQAKNKEVHYIDRLSRYIFPITFTISNIIYFAVCITTA